MMIFDLDKKSNDELITISNGKIPHSLLSAGSTITTQDIITQANIILQKRQKKSQFWCAFWRTVIGGVIVGGILALTKYFFKIF